MIPGLTNAHIREYATPGSFSRGQDYYESGAVLSVVQRGQEVVAQVEGSDYEPYRVRVTINEGGLAGARCDCPYDRGGWCKHIVAVLLTCLHDPDAVAQGPSLESRLQGLGREDLITLILRMIERHDDLATFIELATAASGETVDRAQIRAQVRHAIGRAGYDWRASSRIAEDLWQVMASGETYSEKGAWRNAAAVYQAVLESIKDGYEDIHDEEGEVAQVAGVCAAHLGTCLAQAEEAVEREALLRALFETYLWDINLGGYGISDGVPEAILEQVTPEERRLVAQWVQEAMPPGDPPDDDFSGNWRREELRGFLLDLEADELDDEAFLERCRETGRWYDLVARLLERERVEEGVAEARQVQDRDLLSLAEVFEWHGQTDRIASVILERVQSGGEWFLLPWLKEQAEKRGDDAAALDFSEELFWKNPDVDRYADVKRLAQKTGRWAALRTALEDRLVQQNAYVVFTRIHLSEGEIAQALQRLEQARQQDGRAADWRYSSTYQLGLQVARAAEESHPMEAVRLYRHAAEQLIDQRGRGNYSEAAVHLTHARNLYLRLGRTGAWEQEIQEIRERYRNLPALKDELRKAGL